MVRSKLCSRASSGPRMAMARPAARARPHRHLHRQGAQQGGIEAGRDAGQIAGAVAEFGDQIGGGFAIDARAKADIRRRPCRPAVPPPRHAAAISSGNDNSSCAKACSSGDRMAAMPVHHCARPSVILRARNGFADAVQTRIGARPAQGAIQFAGPGAERRGIFAQGGEGMFEQRQQRHRRKTRPRPLPPAGTETRRRWCGRGGGRRNRRWRCPSASVRPPPAAPDCGRASPARRCGLRAPAFRAAPARWPALPAPDRWPRPASNPFKPCAMGSGRFRQGAPGIGGGRGPQGFAQQQRRAPHGGGSACQSCTSLRAAPMPSSNCFRPNCGWPGSSRSQLSSSSRGPGPAGSPRRAADARSPPADAPWRESNRWSRRQSPCPRGGCAASRCASSARAALRRAAGFIRPSAASSAGPWSRISLEEARDLLPMLRQRQGRQIVQLCQDRHSGFPLRPSPRPGCRPAQRLGRSRRPARRVPSAGSAPPAASAGGSARWPAAVDIGGIEQQIVFLAVAQGAELRQQRRAAQHLGEGVAETARRAPGRQIDHAIGEGECACFGARDQAAGQGLREIARRW